jgi:transposase
VRAIHLERGIVAPQGKRKLEQFLTVLMDEQRGAGLSPRMITRVADARAQWAGLDQRIAAFDTEFIRWTKENEDARRLASIPGVGPTIASALIAAIGKGETFEHGRDLAAWLVWSHLSSPPAADRSFLASASEATDIFASC